MTAQNEAKMQAVRAIVDTLAFIAQERREPDAWECVCLQAAFERMSRGLYYPAAAHARKARVSPDRHTALPPLTAIREYTLDHFRRELLFAETMSVRRHPVFG